MTLHLTRDEADRLTADGRVVLFRAGDISAPSLDDKSTWRDIPPDEFVEAAKPCETCGGDGIVVDRGSRIMNHRVFDRWIDCPDCFNGKRRITAVVPCDEPGCPHVGPCNRGRDGRGYLTVGHVVVTSGSCPVIHWDDQIRIATLDEFVVVGSPTDPTWAAHYIRGDDIGRRMGRFTLPPDVDPQSLVGQYALGIKVAS